MLRATSNGRHTTTGGRSSINTRSKGRAACVMQIETHTILLVCILINVIWFCYMASTASQNNGGTNSHGLEAVYTSSIRGSLESYHLGTTATDATKKEPQLYAFTMRDSQRLVPVDPPWGVHIYDYTDVYHGDQSLSSTHPQLFVDGRFISDAPVCHQYSLRCYKDKIIQVLEHAVKESTTTAEYFFYMESDNTLCVPLLELEQLAVRQNRYFIGTGVGASGWIMRRDFVVDFLRKYKSLGNNMDPMDPTSDAHRMPDVVASWLLMEKNQWAVTNRYLVSHTILSAKGAKGLTQNKPGNQKHLPRCLEPHRGKWSDSNGNGEDAFGWDYFDYQKCPDAEVYPCHDNDEISRTQPPKSVQYKNNNPHPVIKSDKDGKRTASYNYGMNIPVDNSKGDEQSQLLTMQ